jgi:hypothetical protein
MPNLIITLNFLRKQKFLKEKSLQTKFHAQNSYLHVKIGFKILTTIFTKTAFCYVPDICYYLKGKLYLGKPTI